MPDRTEAIKINTGEWKLNQSRSKEGIFVYDFAFPLANVALTLSKNESGNWIPRLAYIHVSKPNINGTLQGVPHSTPDLAFAMGSYQAQFFYDQFFKALYE